MYILEKYLSCGLKLSHAENDTVVLYFLDNKRVIQVKKMKSDYKTYILFLKNYTNVIKIILLEVKAFIQ